MERKSILRRLCLVLCLCLLLGSVPAYADGLSEEQAVELVFEQLYHTYVGPGVPSWKGSAVPGFTDEEVIQYFVEVTLYGEYDGYRGYPLRYEMPITYCVLGEPQGTDVEQLAYLAETLNTIEGYPGISRISDENSATIRIMFSDEASFESHFGLHVPDGSWGYAHCWYYTNGDARGKMSKTVVWISEEASPRQDRDSVICEEFIQGQGMLNDPNHGYYSIFDQNSNDCDWPSPLDWAVIRLLYDPRMDRLAGEAKIRKIAQEILDSWK